MMGCPRKRMNRLVPPSALHFSRHHGPGKCQTGAVPSEDAIGDPDASWLPAVWEPIQRGNRTRRHVRIINPVLPRSRLNVEATRAAGHDD